MEMTPTEVAASLRSKTVRVVPLPSNEERKSKMQDRHGNDLNVGSEVMIVRERQTPVFYNYTGYKGKLGTVTRLDYYDPFWGFYREGWVTVKLVIESPQMQLTMWSGFKATSLLVCNISAPLVGAELFYLKIRLEK